MPSSRILLVDNSDFLLRLMVDFLDSQEGLHVAGTAKDYPQMDAALPELQPDVVVLDLNIPGESGLKVIPHIRARMPRAGIIALSAYDMDIYRAAALASGADDFVPKGDIATELLPAIRRVVQASSIPPIEMGKLQEESPRQLIDRLESALDGLPALYSSVLEGVVWVDSSGDILLVNEVFEIMTGYTREELVGRPIETLIPERLREQHRARCADFSAFPRHRNMGTTSALCLQRKDGSLLPVDIGMSPMSTTEGQIVSCLIREPSQDGRGADIEPGEKEALSKSEDLPPP